MPIEPSQRVENDVHQLGRIDCPVVPVDDFAIRRDDHGMRKRAGPLRVDEIAFGDALKARIWIYDEALMAALRTNPRVAFTPIEATLREAQRHIAAAPYEEARRVYAVLERYYFRGAGPAKRPLAEALRRQVEARREPGRR